jgi:succinyl-diaminopimelate desuccinylase
MKFFKKHESELKGQLIVPVVANEEIGKNSLVYLVQKKLIKANLAIVPDVGRHLKEMSIGEKGKLVINVTSQGKSAHAFQPFMGQNAILPLAEFLLILQKEWLEYKRDKYFDKPTVNIGIIKGGEASNNVPDYAEAEIDIRYLLNQSAKGIISHLRRIANQVKQKYSYAKIRFVVLRDAKPFVISKNHFLVKIIQEESQKVLSQKTTVIAQGGSTIARPLVQAGIPAIGLAPGDEKIFHAPNEYIEIKDLINFAELMGLIVFKIIGK